jgi:hypothetical protein
MATILDPRCEAPLRDRAGPIYTPKEHYRLRAEHHSGSVLIEGLLIRALAGHKALLRRVAEWHDAQPDGGSS